MAQGTFYFDTASFSNATALYTDADLTTLAADGFYSDEIIVREQISGILQAATTCSGCGGAPPVVTLYNVTQNVDNLITGGSLGGEYTLTGDYPGPVTKQYQSGQAYSFNIGLSLADGYECTTGFTASNPSGLTPVGGTTVTNTLTCAIQPIPVVASVKWYYFSGCPNQDGTTSQGGFVAFRAADVPSVNQRYLRAKPDGTKDYYYYDQTIPAQTTVSSGVQLARSGELEMLPGETSCPPIVSAPQYVYQFKNCADNSTNHYAVFSQPQVLDTLAMWWQSDAPQKMRYKNGVSTYSIVRQLKNAADYAGFNQLTDPLLVDLDGVTSNLSTFKGPAYGCPQTYPIFSLCDGSQAVRYRTGATASQASTSIPINDSFFTRNGGLFNGLYLYHGQCYIATKQTTTNPGDFINILQPQYLIRDLSATDCSDCGSMQAI